MEDVNDKDCVATIDFEYKKKPYHIEASGNGPLDAVKTAINKEFDLDVCVLNYSEHALGSGSMREQRLTLRCVTTAPVRNCLVQATVPTLQKLQSVHSSAD